MAQLKKTSQDDVVYEAAGNYVHFNPQKIEKKAAYSIIAWIEEHPDEVSHYIAKNLGICSAYDHRFYHLKRGESNVSVIIEA